MVDLAMSNVIVLALNSLTDWDRYDNPLEINLYSNRVSISHAKE